MPKKDEYKNFIKNLKAEELFDFIGWLSSELEKHANVATEKDREIFKKMEKELSKVQFEAIYKVSVSSFASVINDTVIESINKNFINK